MRRIQGKLFILLITMPACASALAQIMPLSPAGGAGTVTSVGVSAPAIFSVASSPVTSSGTIAISLANESANLIWAGPSTGAATAPTFRSLAAADIPSLSAIYLPLPGGTMSGNINLAQNQLIAPVLDLESSAPGSPTNGQAYYDTVLNQPFFYSNISSSFVGYGAPGATLTVTSSAVTPTVSGLSNQLDVSADANTLSSNTLTINNATGILLDGERVAIRITNSNAGSVAMTPAFGTIYNLNSVSLGTIPAGATAYVGFLYNSGTSKLDLIAYKNGSVVSIANGGTGQTSAGAAFNALSPVTTLGDMMYGSAANTVSRLGGNTTGTINFLAQTGTGSVSAAPVWVSVSSFPTIPVANGGTGQTAAPSVNLYHTTSVPTAAPGAGAGGGGSVSVGTNSNDIGGNISVTTGTTPTASAAIVTVTFHTAFTNAPFVELTPANAATALISGVTMVYVTKTNGTFVINAGTTGLTTLTTYSWDYHTMGN